MTSAGRAIVRKPVAQSSSLSAEAHKQIMDYYKVAENSKNPEISAHALKMAADTGKYQRSQGARLSPNLVVVLGTAIVIAGAAAAWYALSHYSGHLALELSGVALSAVLIAIGLYALLSGHLSEANFMRILDRIKSMWPGSLSGRVDRLEAQDGAPSDSDDPPTQKED